MLASILTVIAGVVACAAINHYFNSATPARTVLDLSADVKAKAERAFRIEPDKEILRAYADAAIAWQSALHRNIDVPKLMQSMQACGGDASACFMSGDGDEPMIVLQDLRGADPKTILMHELGHSLGVPHIEGDALMNAQYVGELAGPTDEAVAIANLKWRRKVEGK